MQVAYSCPWLVSFATGNDKYVSHIHLGENLWFTLCLKRLFFEGCLIGRFVQTVAVMLYFLGGLR